MAGSILKDNVRRSDGPRFITSRGRYMEHLEAVNEAIELPRAGAGERSELGST